MRSASSAGDLLRTTKATASKRHEVHGRDPHFGNGGDAVGIRGNGVPSVRLSLHSCGSLGMRTMHGRAGRRQW